MGSTVKWLAVKTLPAPLIWQYDPNSRWPSTFALKGRPYRIWKAVISVGLVELLKIDILEAT